MNIAARYHHSPVILSWIHIGRKEYMKDRMKHIRVLMSLVRQHYFPLYTHCVTVPAQNEEHAKSGLEALSLCRYAWGDHSTWHRYVTWISRFALIDNLQWDEITIRFYRDRMIITAKYVEHERNDYYASSKPCCNWYVLIPATAEFAEQENDPNEYL